MLDMTISIVQSLVTVGRAFWDMFAAIKVKVHTGKSRLLAA